ncbi:NADAR family protein [Sphingomonas sp. RT2P30]|uniref:NADAR family protein n=1 Tax=Parasphingomonas halimpatiens TaxID=3096162 RepID=UPI002FC79F88
MNAADRPPFLTAADLPDPADSRTFHPFIKGVFSQWHATSFALDGRTFVTVEQWMMFAKAALFGDSIRAAQILEVDDPAVQKRLGALVTPFDQEVWDRRKVDTVYRGNKAKFSQNHGAGRQLRATGDAMLVEANVRDWIWGAGLGMDDPAIGDPGQWRGTNYLGRILTLIRSEQCSVEPRAAR